MTSLLSTFHSHFLFLATIKTFFYNEYIIEIIGSIIFSLMGLAIIWFLRPKVKISQKIAKSKNKDGSYRLCFKVINRSFIFQLVDVHFELSMLEPVSTPKGMNLAIKKIDLKSEHIWFLGRRKLEVLNKKDEGFATYAIILTIKDFDLIKEWEKRGSAFVDLKVIAKNNFSGITGIHHEKYSHSSVIKSGDFCHGNSMDIENGE